MWAVGHFNLLCATFLGFICPVHTPDGSPCGLLNHLSAFCSVVTEPEDSSNVLNVMVELGMIPIGDKCPFKIKYCYKVILDGRVLGYILEKESKQIVDQLRALKVDGVKVTLPKEPYFISKYAFCKKCEMSLNPST